MRKTVLLLLFLWSLSLQQAYGKNEAITVPLIVGDYYAWAYTEAFEDKSDVYAWSTAGVDALGWGIVLTTKEYSGLFFINVAGIAKTVYPMIELLNSSDRGVQERAWIALGTHALTLVSLELFGKPGLAIQPKISKSGEPGVLLAFRF